MARKFTTIEYEVSTQSQTMGFYIKRNLNAMIGSMARVAQILHITNINNESEMKKEMLDIIAETDKAVSEHLTVFDAGFENLITGAQLIATEIQVDKTSISISIGHPVLWKAIDVIKKAEQRAILVELHWLNGSIDDEEHNKLNKELELIMRNYANSIYKATSVEGRTGGKYDVKEFLEYLKERVNNRVISEKEGEKKEKLKSKAA